MTGAPTVRLAERVLRQYSEEPRNIRLVHAAEAKAVWKIETAEGALGLKRFPYGKDRALFAIQAQQHIRNRGGPVAAVRPTRKGDPLAECEDGAFALYEWTEGRKPTFSRFADLRDSVRLLARFHAASEGFRPAIACRESSKLGKWPTQYEKMEINLRKWQTSAEDRKLTYALKPYWKELIRLSDQARGRLRSSEYEKCVRGESPALCHQDFSEGNALLHDNGGSVIDLDSVTYDFPARDLRKLILKRMLVKGRWDSNLYRAIVGWYTKLRPLGKDQLRLLQIDLSFPHLFHEAAKNPYENRSRVPISKLLRVIRIERGKLSDLLADV